MKLYASDYIGRESNTLYPHEIEIKKVGDLRRADSRDHMASAMRDGKRKNENFLYCDCLAFDVDNTHTDDPDEWITEKDIAEALPVKYALVRSRNYMKEKRKKNSQTGAVTVYEPREKWHGYCPLKNRITSLEEYEKLISNVMALFPFIDPAAIDAAHFFYAVENPHVTMEPGEMFLDEYINSMDPEELRAEQTETFNKLVSKYKEGAYLYDKAAKRTVDAIASLLNVPNPLEETAATGPNYEQTQPATPDAEEVPDWIKYSEQLRQVQWLERWAEKNGVTLGRRYYFNEPKTNSEHVLAICVTCPWEEEHSMNGADNEAIIKVYPDGKLKFLCRHRHGAALDWNQYRAKCEENARARRKAEQPPETVADPEPEGPQDGPALDDLDEFFEKIQTEAYRPYTTGLSFFDNLLGGGVIMQTVTLIMAAPGAGKTTLCQQIAEEMAMRKKPVVFLNLEMSKEQMIAKAISSRAALEHNSAMTATDILQGYRWLPEAREIVTKTIREYREKIFPYMKYNPADLDSDLDHILSYLDAIGQRARDKGEDGPAVVLDYLHLITTENEKLDDKGLIKKTMKGIKDYCIKYNSFAFIISATNRVANKSGQIGQSDGRDSSNIEYGCDAQISLNFWEVDQGEVSPNKADEMGDLLTRPNRRMILRVLKSRFSQPGRYARVWFNAATSRFYGEYDFIPASISGDLIPFDEQDPNAGSYNLNALTLPENTGTADNTKTPGRKRRKGRDNI